MLRGSSFGFMGCVEQERYHPRNLPLERRLMSIYMTEYAYIYASIREYIYIYIYIYIHICVCEYIYICMLMSGYEYRYIRESETVASATLDRLQIIFTCKAARFLWRENGA